MTTPPVTVAAPSGGPNADTRAPAGFTTSEECSAPSEGGGGVPDLESDPSGLTLDEHAAILEALAIVLQVCQGAARRTLEAERPAADAYVAWTAERAAERRTAAQPGNEVVAALQAELDDAVAYGAGLQAAAGTDDVRARIRARAERASADAVMEEIRARITDAQRRSDPYTDAARQAEQDHQRARADLDDLDHAIRFPFITNRGQATPAWSTYLRRTGMVFDQDSPAARTIIRGFLERTGMGAELEGHAIAAYLAGDPAARAAGDTKTWAGGITSLVRNADGPPVVMNGRATPEQMTSPDRPPVPAAAPSGAEVSGGLRTAAGQLPPTVTKAATEPIEQQWVIPSAIGRLLG